LAAVDFYLSPKRFWMQVLVAKILTYAKFINLILKNGKFHIF